MSAVGKARVGGIPAAGLMSNTVISDIAKKVAILSQIQRWIFHPLNKHQVLFVLEYGKQIPWKIRSQVACTPDCFQ